MNSDSGLYSKKVIADLLNLSERRVEQLAQKKIIPKAQRGKFDLGPTVKAYIMYLQQKLSGGDCVIDVSEYKDRLLRATALEQEEKAKLRELIRLKTEGELISREEVASEWVSRIVALKSSLLAMPVQIGFRFPDSEVRALVESEVEKAVYGVLEAYSRGVDPDAGRKESVRASEGHDGLGVGGSASDPDESIF